MSVSAPCHWPGVEQRQASGLIPAHVGLRVQLPGNRGRLRGVWTDDDGRITVCTSAGIGHYAPETACWLEAS